MSAPALSDRLRGVAERLAGFPSPRVQRLLLAVVVPVMVVIAVLSYRSLRLDLSTVGWGSLALAGLLGGPVSATVTAWEFQTSAAAMGHRVGLWAALRVTMIATALNYLPGHGGALWRVQQLRRMGSGYGRATTITVTLALVWLGLTAVAAGGLLVGHDRAVAAWGFTGLGIAGLLAAGVLLRRHHPGRRAATRWGARIVVVETCSIAVSVGRLFLVLHALGHQSGITPAVVLALAAILASATGILRGGLGLRELLAGTFAPLVGLPVALGFLASAVDGLVGTFALVPLALLLYARYGAESPVEQADAHAGVGAP